jgi:hypothetical protein
MFRRAADVAGLRLSSTATVSAYRVESSGQSPESNLLRFLLIQCTAVAA